MDVLLEGGPQRPQLPQAQRGVLGGTCNAAAPTTLNSRPQASANPSPSLFRGLLRRDARAACPTSRSPQNTTGAARIGAVEDRRRTLLRFRSGRKVDLAGAPAGARP